MHGAGHGQAHPGERAAVYAMFTIVAMEAAVNFSVATYIQIVQGRTPFDTSLAMMSFNLTVFVTATLIVRFYKRHTPRTIALFAFGYLFGFVGLLLAAPLAAIIAVLCRFAIGRYMDSSLYLEMELPEQDETYP